MPLATLLKQGEYLAGFLIARASGWPLERAARVAWRMAAWLGAAALADYGATAWCGGDTDYWSRILSNTFWPDQTNHLAGFMSLGAVLGLALAPGAGHRPRLDRMAWLAGEGLILLGILATGSRGAALAAVAGVALFAAARRRWKPLGLGLVVLITCLASRERGGFFHEYKGYLISEERAEAGAPRLNETERNRLEVWTALRTDILRFPILGTGPGSRNRVFYESQWVMTLAETGVMGLAALLLLLIVLARTALDAGGPWGGAFLGLLGCVAVQGLVTETLLVTRIAGPFWLLWGVFLGSGRDGRDFSK